MSRPLALPVRLLSQPSRQSTSTQCLRQRSVYSQLHSSTSTTRQQPRWTPSKRAFATSPQNRAPRPQMKQPAQPSVTRTQKEQQAAMMRDGKMPDDVGLLDSTFVLPRSQSERWKWPMMKKWLRTRFVELYGALAFKWILVKPRPKLELSKIAPTAATLHSEMYKAFAAGNLAPVSDRVCSGLFGSLRGRISQRAPNTFLRWSVTKELSKPKLCSYKAAVLPGPKGETSVERNAQIQAVVRLHTMQSLQHVKKVAVRTGRALQTVEENVGAEEVKESVEYVVVQRTVRKGKWNPWSVWGFTDETSLKQVMREAAGKK